MMKLLRSEFPSEASMISSGPSEQRRRLGFGALLALTVAIGALQWSGPIEAQGQFQKPPLTFTAAQAGQGQTAYAEHCASCHGQYLDDGPFAPPLKGVDFRAKWGLRSADGLFTLISTKMPPVTPGALGDATYGNLLAYILEENGSQPGASELPADPVALNALGPPSWPQPDGGGLAPGATIPPPPRLNPLDKIRPPSPTPC
jgi:mono/diheme cytochrome c family protein